MEKKRIRNRLSEAEKKWIAKGKPIKKIKIPILADTNLIERTCQEDGLNLDYALMLLYKVLFSRKTAKKEYRDCDWFQDGYTTLSSTDLQKWIGKNYPKYISLLSSIGYLEYKRSENGGISYQALEGKGLCARYRINPQLLQITDGRNLFEKLTNFRYYQLIDYKLINKLYNQYILNMNKLLVKHSHQLLADKISKVRFRLTDQILLELTEKYNDIIVGDMLSLMDSINSGDIYVKRELDEYGERFHSSLTFTWSILRRYIYFEDSEDSVSYLDIKNSQFYFFSQLTPELIARITPEFKHFCFYLEGVKEEPDYKEFCQLCENGQIYEFIRDYYVDSNLTFPLSKEGIVTRVMLEKDDDSRSSVKTFLMQVLFSDKGDNSVLKKEFALLFPAVARLIKTINNNFMKNFLPELLQKLEARVLLDKFSIALLSGYQINNLVSIHDGLLFNTSDGEMVQAVLKDIFLSLGMSLPQYKLDLVENIIKLSNSRIYKRNGKEEK